jgi:hypothetical protein
MTSLARRERSQLGQLTLTANAQGHRLRAAERPARSGAAPTESKTAASTGGLSFRGVASFIKDLDAVAVQ